MLVFKDGWYLTPPTGADAAAAAAASAAAAAASADKDWSFLDNDRAKVSYELLLICP